MPSRALLCFERLCPDLVGSRGQRRIRLPRQAQGREMPFPAVHGAHGGHRRASVPVEAKVE